MIVLNSFPDGNLPSMNLSLTNEFWMQLISFNNWLFEGAQIAETWFVEQVKSQQGQSSFFAYTNSPVVLVQSVGAIYEHTAFSAKSAGIVATLFTLDAMMNSSVKREDEESAEILIQHYYALKQHIETLPIQDARNIYRAID
jgi:hypothetical protein